VDASTREAPATGPALPPDPPPDPPPDLRPPADDPLRHAVVPPGWEPVAAVARRVAAQLDALTERVLGDIAAELPEYAGEIVPRPDLAASIVRNLEMMLLGLAERRGRTNDELAVRRVLGARRAEQGLPVDTLIQAFHVGYRELWRSLVDAVPPDDPETAAGLLVGATTIWSWVHEVSSAISAAHGETVRSHEARAIGIRRRLVELVVAGDVRDGDARGLAVAAGFDPDGPVVATVVRTGAGDPADPEVVQQVLEGFDGVHAAAQRGASLVVLTQAGPPPAAALAERLPSAAIGVGLERSGLSGARASLEDADRVASLGVHGARAFAETWIWASLSHERERLRPLLAGGSEAAEEHPHLAETVLAFADAGFSVTEAARSLELHANTVAYRLDRWHQLTGWDVRSLEGLVRSIAAIRLPLATDTTP
jgi:hypothetical protein